MKSSKFLFPCILLWVSLIFSQDGSPDVTFGNNGSVITNIEGESKEYPQNIIQRPNGGILVSGVSVDNEDTGMLVSYSPDGTIDSSFGTNGIVLLSNATFREIAIQQNENIIATNRTLSDFDIYRFSPDGSQDFSFGTNGTIKPFTNFEPQSSMLLLPDDQIIAAATIDENGLEVVQLKKFLVDGNLDNSFGTSGTVEISIGNQETELRELKVSGSNILVLTKIRDSGITSYNVIRLLPTGEIDASFGSNGIAEITIEDSFQIRSMAVYDNGDFVILSAFIDSIEESTSNRISKYSSNGQIDTSFGDNGLLTFDPSSITMHKLMIQTDDKIVYLGELTNFFEGGGPSVLGRLHLDGTLDSSFEQTEILNFEIFVVSGLLQTDDKLVVVAFTAWYSGVEDIVLERYNNSSTLSTSDYLQDEFTVTPNPSRGIFVIQHRYKNGNIYPFKIFDQQGREIWNDVLQASKSNIDLSGFDNGIYFIRSGKITKKLVKF